MITDHCYINAFTMKSFNIVCLNSYCGQLGPAPIVNGNGAPPPPPPPPMGGLNSHSMDMSSLAAQLQQKKNTLKGGAKGNPPPPPPAENSGSSTSSGGSGNYGTIGRSSTGMASMMDEMAKTLARRRAQAEKKPEVCSLPILPKYQTNLCTFN